MARFGAEFKLFAARYLCHLCGMKELFRERDFTKIGYFRSVLEGAGIETLIRNEVLSGVEVPIPDFFPALCVVHDEDYDRAIATMREHAAHDSAKSEEEIACQGCGEGNPGNFEICWSCGGEVQAL
jgi:hypothetical protein